MRYPSHRSSLETSLSFLPLILLFVAPLLEAQSAQKPTSSSLPSPRTITLKATPKTVAWGYYDAAAAPVLQINSGDSVEFETLITSSPKRLEGAGVAPEQVQQSLRDIYNEVTN